MAYDLYLADATYDDVDILSDIIVKTSEGILDYVFGTVQNLLGLDSINEFMSMALLEDKGDFSLGNITLLRCKENCDTKDRVVGLCLAYPIDSNANLLPKIILPFISKNAKSLMKSILPVNKKNSLSFYLNTLWVDPDYRKRNLGSLFIEYLKSEAIQYNCDSIVLHCFNDNASAIKFYKANGFCLYKNIEYPTDFSSYHPQGGGLWRLSLSNESK